MRVGLVSPCDFGSPGGVNDHVRHLPMNGEESCVASPGGGNDHVRHLPMNGEESC